MAGAEAVRDEVIDQAAERAVEVDEAEAVGVLGKVARLAAEAEVDCREPKLNLVRR